MGARPSAREFRPSAAKIALGPIIGSVMATCGRGAHAYAAEGTDDVGA
jgi:hypothetical protein